MTKKIDEANSRATAKVKLQHYSHKAHSTQDDVHRADNDRNPAARAGAQAFVGTPGSKKRRKTLHKVKRMKQAVSIARAMVSTSDRPDYNLPKKKFLSGGKSLREFIEESAEILGDSDSE